MRIYFPLIKITRVVFICMLSHICPTTAKERNKMNVGVDLHVMGYIEKLQ